MEPLQGLSDQVSIKYQCLQFRNLIILNYDFSSKGYLRISTTGKHIENIRIKNLTCKNDVFFHIFDQIKVSRVPL